MVYEAHIEGHHQSFTLCGLDAATSTYSGTEIMSQLQHVVYLPFLKKSSVFVRRDTPRLSSKPSNKCDNFCCLLLFTQVLMNVMLSLSPLNSNFLSLGNSKFIPDTESDLCAVYHCQCRATQEVEDEASNSKEGLRMSSLDACNTS